MKISPLSYYKANDSHVLSVGSSAFYLNPSSPKAVKQLEKENIKLLENSRQDLNVLQFNKYNEIIKLREKYLSQFSKYSSKRIYLFQDRIDSADDNAYHLFKYACKINDGIEKYFVVSRQSKQWDELSKIGKVVEYGSFDHKLLILFADKLITTHPYDTVINPFLEEDFDSRPLISGLLNYKIYWLQHGVTKDNISEWMSKFDKNLSLIVTVSDKESESFLEEGYGYSEDIIQNLGFPRFDNLEKNDVKQILIIPTWRKNITGNRGIFRSSEYFHNLDSLLHSDKLLAMADKGYRIVFRPHPELFKEIGDLEDNEDCYIDLFDIPSEIHMSFEESYQELINNSSVLITDYSSVFFDFAYLKKPIIYYHPENESYHYGESYFDYETMGFGEISTTSGGVFDKLNEYIDNGCRMEDEYKRRVDEFFTYTDKGNCKRVWDWILKN